MSTETGVRSDLWHGIVFVVVGISLLSVQDVIIRAISGRYPVHEIVLVRSADAFILLLLLAWYEGQLRSLKSRRLGKQMMRGSVLLLSYTTYYLALAALPLADAVALFFVAPLFVTILSIIILHEAVARRYWLSLGAGFAGMLLMLRPGQGLFEPAALLALAAAATYALSIIWNRQLADTESGVALAFFANLAYLLLAGLIGVFFHDGVAVDSAHPSIRFLTRAWLWPALSDLFLLIGTGFTAATGFYCLSQAYRISPATTVAPFEYLMLPLSAIWGYAIWREVPDGLNLVGASVVIASGLYLLPRRRRRRWLWRA